MKLQRFRKFLMPVLTAVLVLCFFGTQTTVMKAEGEDPAVIEYAPVNPYYGGWGNCTWSAWQLCYQYTGVALPRLGNAGAWYGTAASMGIPVGQAPAVNSVGVWSNHVVFVTEVSADGSQVYIKEGGYCGGYNEGWIDAFSSRNGQAFIGYIYITNASSMPVLSYVDLSTGETVYTKTAGTVTKIEFPEVEESVIRVDDAAKEVPVKQEDQLAKEERLKEDREQRAAAVSNKNKQGCD
jgi:surface antigen